MKLAQRRIRRTILSKWGGLLASAMAVAAASGVIALVAPRVPAPYLLVLYVLVVMAVAIVWGTWMAVFTAVLSIVVFSYLFVYPSVAVLVDDPSNVVGAAAFLVTAVVVGRLTARFRRAALDSARLSEEQFALRRIATLVAQSGPPSAVFEAVTREVGLLCDADLARMERYEEDGTVTGVAAWSRVPVQLAVGTRFSLGGPSIAREVRETGGPVRVASFAGATGAIAQEALGVGIRSSVGCPITVAGHLWGVIAASTKRNEPFPANTESQIANFTELVATAVANADSREELAASRARVVAAGDQTRRRLERNLHDGAQQRLVSLALHLRITRDAVPADLTSLRADLDRASDDLAGSLVELREISRGLHPAVLSRGGLGPALRTLARRCPLPVDVHLHSESRYPPTVEVAAYYVVSEALTNTLKHAAASRVEVDVDERDNNLLLRTCDDGIGGADPRRGSGLTGLRDRIEALGGSIEVISPADQGTTMKVSLPIDRQVGESVG
jgi:signal transduction histidine kinase